jgi:hypothetical protein
MVRIDVEDMRQAKEVGEQEIVLAAVPLAAYPAEIWVAF